jgi:hypothetical protein
VYYTKTRDDWGARSTQWDEDDPSFLEQVNYVVVHWGGGTRQLLPEEIPGQIYKWQGYHMSSKGMTDIAYNYLFDDYGDVWVGRGLNPGGHVSCSKDRDPSGRSYCQSSLGICWLGGKNDADGPSPEAYGALRRIIRSLPGVVSVKGHRTVKQENGSWTECPGEDLLDWVSNKEWMMANQETSNPAFQPAFDKALASGMFSEFTDVSDVTTAEKLAVYLDRVGFFEALAGEVPPHTHPFEGVTG